MKKELNEGEMGPLIPSGVKTDSVRTYSSSANHLIYVMNIVSHRRTSFYYYIYVGAIQFFT